MGSKGRGGGYRGFDVDLSKPDGDIVKPAFSDDAASEKWDELITQIPVGVLRRIDRHELKMLCDLLAMSDSLSAISFGDPGDHATVRIWYATIDRIHRLSASFGLNPGDRQRLGDVLKPVAEEEDPYSVLMGRGGEVN